MRIIPNEEFNQFGFFPIQSTTYQVMKTVPELWHWFDYSFISQKLISEIGNLNISIKLRTCSSGRVQNMCLYIGIAEEW